MVLHNKYSKEDLIKRLEKETFKRRTVSFYRYFRFENPEESRDQLYKDLEELGVLGRIYVAEEGINGQVSVPEPKWDEFCAYLRSLPGMSDLPLKLAIEDDGKSFLKLVVKVRKKIVADGLDDNTFDASDVGTHLTAEEFNKLMEEDAIVVDMRNHYETEVGHFEGAICPEADTFREELPMVIDLLKDKKDKKVLMYCTGGVRCEKASAYLRHNGFKDVYQLYGGIIEYAREIREKGLPSKFKGKNFVFDERLGERVTEDILSHCHQCGEPCDTHTNCANDECHLLFIQCEKCASKYHDCCSSRCKEIASLPVEKQKELRKGKVREYTLAVHKSRLRPRPGDLMEKE